ncbi:MAG TPA: hypothetical protein VHE82_00105 [Gemmatimonadaceae bacterium]|nr:hypothetical protein [Gemmatimonadaceae bacterium]
MPSYDVDRDVKYFEPDHWSLWFHLETARDHWEEVYRAFWELDEAKPINLTFKTWELAKELDSIAAAMYGVASQMRVEGGDGEPLSQARLLALRNSLASHAEISVVKSRLELELGKDVLERLRLGADRVKQVLSLITYAPKMPFPAEYLEKATRLYLLGCDLECLILCRCTLESALKREFDDNLMRSSVGPKQRSKKTGSEYDYTLEQYLSCAERQNRLTGEVLQKAKELKKSANIAIHGIPAFERTQVPSAQVALENLTTVLSKLFCVD